MQLSNEDLRKGWVRWVNDKSLQAVQSFGKYMLYKHGKTGEYIPDLLYGRDTEKQYNTLFKIANPN